MTIHQQAITLLAVVIATQLTRWLPFVILNVLKRPSSYIDYMGRFLPPAIFGMLVVYCYKDVSMANIAHSVPMVVAGCCVALLQALLGNMGLSIMAGTAIYVVWCNV